MAFDANGDLYVGGQFRALGSTNGNGIVKINMANGTITPLATGISGDAYARVISMALDGAGNLYVGGRFTSAGGVLSTTNIAKWNGTTWSALSTGLNNDVFALTRAPNGDLYIGGLFTNTAYPYLCKWNGTAFSAVGTNTDITFTVRALTFDATGCLYVGGSFLNAGGNANADYIAKWTGT